MQRLSSLIILLIFNIIWCWGQSNLPFRSVYRSQKNNFYPYSTVKYQFYDTPYDSEYLIKKKIDSTPNDPYVGIYEGDIWKYACIKEEGNYYIIKCNITSLDRYYPWKIGDVAIILRETAIPGCFLGDWLECNAYRNITYTYPILFSQGMFQTERNDINYIKNYPLYTSSNSVKGNKESWTGTGFALNNGYIVTNYHVIEDAKKISVYGIEESFNLSYSAEIIATDKNNDLAIIKIKDNFFSGFGKIPYSINTSMVEVGEDIFVLGYPMTSTMGEEIKLTTGVISSKTGFQGDVSLYQISAPIQPGNSGGPLFDKKGNVIGIVNAKHQGAENVGYAIKTSYLKTLIESSINQSVIPNINTISNLPLTGKVREEKKFVFLIKCTN